MNKEIKFKFDWLLWFLILLPTFYLVNKDLRHIQMNFFQISIIMMVAFLHINKWFGAFLGWATFQLIFFPDVPDKSILLQNILFAGVLYHFIVKYVGNLKKYFWVFVALLAVNVGWSFLQMAQIDPLFSQANPQNQTLFSEYPGFFGIPALLGNYAAFVLPLCMVLNPFLGILAIPALIFSKSSFSILAASGGLLFFLWFRKRIVFWGALIAILVMGSLYIVKFDAPSGQFSRRLTVWKMILYESFRNQFFGYGIGTYNKKYIFLETTPDHIVRVVQNDREAHLAILESASRMKKQPVLDYMIGKKTSEVNSLELQKIAQKSGMDFMIWQEAHNEFLQAFFEFGLLGLICIFGYIGNIFRRFWRMFHSTKNLELLALMSSFIAILIVSFAHFPFHVARLAGPCIVIMALLETKLLRNENADSN